MSYDVAVIFDEDDAQLMNDGVIDDLKMAFTVPTMDAFYCTTEDAEKFFGIEEKGIKYDGIVITVTQWNGTFPLPKRRKLPI